MIKEIKPYGTKALLVVFEQVISEEIHQQVIVLRQWIEQQSIKGITHTVPAYCSLTVGYEPEQTDFQTIKKIIDSFKTVKVSQELANKTTRLFKIPICYAPQHAPDLETVCQLTQLGTREVISLHNKTIYHVFMLGFLLGFPYMGQLPLPLQLPRKNTPTPHIAAGAVGIAAQQTGIYPINSPGGWHIIGQTPVPVFNAQLPMPFLLQAGDKVQFYEISTTQFQIISEEVQVGKFIVEPEIIIANCNQK